MADTFIFYCSLQLKGYAQSQSATPAVDSSYMGMAVGERNAKVNYYVGDGDAIVVAAYLIPFIVTFVCLVAGLCTICCSCAPVEEVEKSVRGSPRLQANIVAALLLCGIFSIYTFVLDMRSLVIECKKDLPSYYKEVNGFAKISNVLAFIYIIILSPAVELLLFVLCWICKFACQKCTNGGDPQGSPGGGAPQGSPGEGAPQGSPGGGDPQGSPGKGAPQGKLGKIKRCISSVAKWIMKKYNSISHTKRMAVYCILVAGSAILSLAAHFPSILMAWATDPFYASRIAIFYGFSIGAYFTVFHFTYIISKSSEVCCYPVKKLCRFFIICSSLFISAVIVSVIIIVLALFVVTVPVTNSIETASEGVSTIYSGAVVLIGGLVAYRFGWHYIGRPFSVSDALKKALKKMKLPLIDLQQNIISERGKWDQLTEEGRLTEVMKMMICDELLKHKV